MDEQTAVRRLKRGDLNGLAVLVKRYEVQAVRTAYLITRDRASAEDVAHSAFLRAAQRIHQFDERRPFGPWFLRSVANAALQVAQRDARQLPLDEPTTAPDGPTWAELLPDPAPGPDETVDSAELRREVWAALGKLPAEQRTTVVLRYFLDLSDDEMAQALDIAPGTVRWRLHAARKHLRVLLHRFGRSQGWQEG